MTKINIKRSEEREFAFTMLYASEFNQEPLNIQIEHLDELSQQKATPYVRRLISFYMNSKDEFDGLIKKKLENWDLKRVAIIDKVILRMAIVEIVHFDDIPPEVSINEAIELAKKYSTAGSGKFINGLLDAIYRIYKTKNRSMSKKEGISAD
jgi:N utilization substance protein B